MNLKCFRELQFLGFDDSSIGHIVQNGYHILVKLVLWVIALILFQEIELLQGIVFFCIPETWALMWFFFQCGFSWYEDLFQTEQFDFHCFGIGSNRCRKSWSSAAMVNFLCKNISRNFIIRNEQLIIVAASSGQLKIIFLSTLQPILLLPIQHQH